MKNNSENIILIGSSPVGRTDATLGPEEFWLNNFTSADTRRAYLSDVRSFLAFAGLGKPEDVRSVTAATVLAWRRRMEEDGCGARTVARRLAALTSLFSDLVSRGLVTSNPARDVRRPRVSPDGTTPGLTPDEVFRMFAAAGGDAPSDVRDAALLRVLAYTGLRRAEVARLTVDGLVRHGPYLCVAVRAKGGREQRIPLPSPARAAVERYLRSSGSIEGPLFRRPDGGPLGPAGVNEIVKRRAAQAGVLTPVTAHSFRVTLVTNALARGVALEDVRDTVGHANDATTRRYDRGTKARPERSASLRVSFGEDE